MWACLTDDRVGRRKREVILLRAHLSLPSPHCLTDSSMLNSLYPDVEEIDTALSILDTIPTPDQSSASFILHPTLPNPIDLQRVLVVSSIGLLLILHSYASSSFPHGIALFCFHSRFSALFSEVIRPPFKTFPSALTAFSASLFSIVQGFTRSFNYRSILFKQSYSTITFQSGAMLNNSIDELHKFPHYPVE